MSYDLVKFGDILEIKTGKLDANAMVENGKYPFFTCSRQIYSINSYSFDCEAVLLAGNNASGDFNVKYYTGKFDAYQRTYVLTKKVENISLGLVKYKLEGYLAELKKISLGANTRFLKLGMIKDITIPVPPLQEQQQIVEKLDQAFELIDQAKANIEQNIINAKELFQSKLDEVFSQKGDGWTSQKLGDLCMLIARGVSPKYDDDSETRVINQKCVRNHEINMELTRGHNLSLKTIREDRYIKLGDVLINSTGTGTLGRVAQVREVIKKTTVDTHVTIVRPIENLFYNDFFGWAMVSIEKKLQDAGEGASGQTELSRKKISEEFYISYPECKKLQENIVKTLDGSSELTNNLIYKYQQKLDNLEELRKSILEKAFKGELTNQTSTTIRSDV